MWEDAALRLFGRVDTAERVRDAARWMALASALGGIYLITAAAPVRGILWLTLALAYWLRAIPPLGWAMFSMAVVQLALSIKAAITGSTDYVEIGVSLIFIVFAGRAVQVAHAASTLEKSP